MTFSTVLLLKLVSVPAVLFVTFIGSSLPFYLKSRNRLNEGGLLLHISNHLTSGVFVSAAILHLLPDATNLLKDQPLDIHPFSFPASFLMAGLGILFADFCANVTASEDEDGHGHGLQLLPTKHHRERENQRNFAPPKNYQSVEQSVSINLRFSFDDDDDGDDISSSDDTDIIPEELASLSRSSSLRSSRSEKTNLPYFLALLLGFHSLVAGVALGASNSVNSGLALLIAILAHKWAESFALSLTLTKQEIPMRQSICIVTMYSLMCPLGTIVSTIITGFLSTRSTIWTESLLTALAAGCFCYVGITHMMENELNDKKGKVARVMSQAVGFSLMLMVSIWV